MPFVLVSAGILMIVTGALGTYAQFGKQVAGDFTGKGNFLYWLAAIFAVGALGYYSPLQGVSRLFILLIIISMVLSNRGFFAKFQEALNKGPVAPAPINGASSATNTLPGSGPSFIQSLKKPGGGGFWDWSGIPSPFGSGQ